MKSPALVVPVALLALVSCSSDVERPAGPRVGPPTAAASIAQPALSPTPTPVRSIAATTCPNQTTTVAGARQPGTITGDIDGDGAVDQIQIAIDRAAEQGCQAFLLAATQSGEVSGPIAAWSLEGGLPQPRLHSVAQVNGSGGDEVIVDVAQGASTQFVSVLTDVGGAFFPLTLPKTAPTSQHDVFAYGGSVGHLDAPDCADGEIVVSFAVPQGNVYRVTRRFYTVEDAALRSDESRDRTSTAPFNGLGRFPEFSTAPFGNCPA